MGVSFFFVSPFFSHFSLTPNPIKGKNKAVVHPTLEIHIHQTPVHTVCTRTNGLHVRTLG